MKKCEGCCGCYLLSGVSRLNDCDSNLGKTTFIVGPTDRQRPAFEKSHSLPRPLGGNVADRVSDSLLSIKFFALCRPKLHENHSTSSF